MPKSTSEPVIRIAAAEDAGMIALLRSLWAGKAAGDTGFEQRIADWLASEGDRRTTWLAEVGTAPVGMASMLEYRRMPWPDRAESRWGYVSNMFVRAEHRNYGIGSALLAALVAAGERRGYVRLVTSPSDDAQSLYERAGFRPADGQRATRLLVHPYRSGRSG